MLALILAALRVRAAQAITLMALTALAATTAAALPWAVTGSAGRTAAAHVAEVPPAGKALSVSGPRGAGSDPEAAVREFAALVGERLPISGATPVRGLVENMSVVVGNDVRNAPVAYRDRFCENVRVTGACPAAAGEVAISAANARAIGVAPGARLTLARTGGDETLEVRVAGTYQLSDPRDAYWSNAYYRATTDLDPIFGTSALFAGSGPRPATLTYDVTVPDAVLRGDGGADLRPVLAAAAGRLGGAEVTVGQPLGALLTDVAQDRAAVRSGIAFALAQVLLLALFTIALAAYATSRSRRADAALHKLRGSGTLATLRLTFGQHLVPMAAGALAGLPVGLLLARLAAGPVSAADTGPVVRLAALAVAAVLLAALLAVAAVEAVLLRSPVSTLLRHVPLRRRAWPATVLDTALLAAAVAAIYQTRSGAPRAGIAVAAPTMTAVAVALLLARALAPLAEWSGGAAVRSGRLRWGLSALQLTRRPGYQRLFAFLVVAVAMGVTGAGAWVAGREERLARARVELGADQVLTVRVANRTALLSAVRRADPAGRWAMAAVVDPTAHPPVLAVDTARLAAVSRWRPEYGPVARLPAATTTTGAPAPLPLITGTRLTLRAVNRGRAPLTLTATLRNEITGRLRTARFGPISGATTITAHVDGCTPDAGCRLARWQLLGAPHGEVTVRGLAQADPPAVILDRDRLADIGRWRSTSNGAAVDIRARDGGLSLAMDANPRGFATPGRDVMAVDGPTPLPVVLAGAPPQQWRLDDAAVFLPDGERVPVTVAGTPALLPVLGRQGMLIDLDAARRAGIDDESGVAYQVWLGPDAPPTAAATLTAAGLSVTAERTVARRTSLLAAQPPAVVSRVSLLAAGLALLIAATVMAITFAADRQPTRDQLEALRTQGLSRPGATAVAWAGPVALLAAGLLGGLLAAALAAPVTGLATPGFPDGWALLAAPAPIGPTAATVTLLAALALFGLAGWVSIRPLARGLR
ncbi:ABC transporter permease [Actinoplanes sp. NPDC089786]|uniref:ABC transporter permease n=1 Tax=Actinoplanes sp. NPDC089786 TaxID=3155185 RepID=UPI00342E0A79